MPIRFNHNIYMGNEIPADTATFKVRGRGFEPGEPFVNRYDYYFQVGDINNDDYDDLLLSYRVKTVPPSP